MKQVNEFRRNVKIQNVVGVVILLLCTSLIRLITSPFAGIRRGQSGFGSGLDFASTSRFGQSCLRLTA